MPVGPVAEGAITMAICATTAATSASRKNLPIQRMHWPMRIPWGGAFMPFRMLAAMD